MSRPRAYQLIESASTVSTIVDKGHPPPATESQARPLAKLPPAEQPEAQPGPDGTSARTSAAVGIGPGRDRSVTEPGRRGAGGCANGGKTGFGQKWGFGQYWIEKWPVTDL